MVSNNDLQVLVLTVTIRPKCILPLSQINLIKDVLAIDSSQGKMPKAAQCTWRDRNSVLRSNYKKIGKYHSEVIASLSWAFPSLK